MEKAIRKYCGDNAVSWYKCVFFNSICGYEDFLNCGATVSDIYPSNGEAVPPFSGKVSPSTMNALFTVGEIGTGSIIQLSITTVYSALNREPRPWERHLMSVNAATPQWAVAAIILGLNSLSVTLCDVLVYQYGLHLLPLREWKDSLKRWLNCIRRCPILHANPLIRAGEVLDVRKIITCTGRDKQEADWDAEYDRRTNNIPAHMGLNANGKVSRKAWNDSIAHQCESFADKIVSETVDSSRLDTLDDWWASRWAWTASGSSSKRPLVDYMLKEDDRLTSGARANKKCIAEELSDSYARELLYGMAPVYVARGSTKPEPGFKPRAIFAVDDDGQIVSGYASVHIEKHMNVDGIKAKQTPADVVSWMDASRVMKEFEVWLSLDYSDYNTEHEPATRMQFNYAMARAWNRRGRGHKWCGDKIAAATWVAQAHSNSYVTDPARSDGWRVFGGLFSGDRDTARDNTALHGVYSQVMLNYTKLVDHRARLVSPNYTGDDEDSKMNDWVSAMLYMIMHAFAGFVLKPEKQMCSACNHEFLQRMIVPDALPTRPLFAALSQFASGNWYTDVYMWYDSAIAAISANCWEMASRGMPLPVARRIAKETLNAAMRVSVRTAEGIPDGWHNMEWWEYRNGGETEHPLWWGSGDLGKVCPAIKAKPEAMEGASGRASAAWIRLKKSEIGVHNAGAWEAYEGHCKKEAYAALYVRTRAETHRRFALHEWPERHSEIPNLDYPGPPVPTYEEVMVMISTNPTDRRPARLEEVVSRMGLDMTLVSLLGGLDTVLLSLKPDVTKYYSNPDVVGHIPIIMHWLDPAIKSWYGATSVSKVDKVANYKWRLDRQWPQRLWKGGIPDRTRIVLLAPNGAGKSHFIESNSWCAESDRIISTMRLHQALHANSKVTGNRSPVISRTFEDILAHRGYFGLCTQLDPSEFVPPPNMRDYKLSIVVVRPSDEVLTHRLLNRGWSMAKVIRRLQRWDNTMARAFSTPNWASAEELAHVTHLTTFDEVTMDKLI